MLDHRYATRCDQQRRPRREIETPGRIAARTDDIDRGDTSWNLRPARQPPHRAGEAAHFIGDDAFGAQRSEDGSRHGRREIRLRQFAQYGLRLRLGEAATIQQLLEQRFQDRVPWRRTHRRTPPC